MNDNIKKLKEITNNLPTYPFPAVMSERVTAYKEYEMENGVCFGWLVREFEGKIAVHRWYNSGITKFPLHTHKSAEYFFIYSGEMDLILEDKTITLKDGDTYCVKPNILHGASFKGIDTKYLTVTIPPAEEFPYDR